MQRPTTVTVFGILNLVFGALGLCGIAGTFATFMIPQDANLGNPALDVMESSAAYQTFMMVSAALGLVATLVLIAAGVGLLQMKPWGRTASIGYSMYAIVMGIVGIVMNYVFVMAPLMEKAENLPGGPEKAGLMGGAIGGTIGSCFGLVYPVILLIFMFRPSVKAAFTTRDPEETSTF